MKLKIKIIAQSSEKEKLWKQDLETKLYNRLDFEFLNEVKDAQVVLLDQSIEGFSEMLTKIDRAHQVCVLVVENPNLLPEALIKNQVDDVLVAPFKLVEVISRFRLVEKLLGLKQLGNLNLSLTEIFEALKESYSLI